MAGFGVSQPMATHIPIDLYRKVVRPRLGWTVLPLVALYSACAVVWSSLYANEQAILLPVVMALGFWLSIRPLLREGHPPERVCGSVLFTIHLIHLLVLILMVVGLGIRHLT
jgi:hypothetical protein